MENILEIYRCLNFDGFIYARLHTDKTDPTVTYTLYRNDISLAQLTCHDSHRAVCFEGQNAGSFRVGAELTIQDGKTEQFLSEIISVSAPLRLRAGNLVKAAKNY
ncbi:hypothetical protein ACWKX5_07840 [Enterobacter asburiae]